MLLFSSCVLSPLFSSVSRSFIPHSTLFQLHGNLILSNTHTHVRRNVWCLMMKWRCRTIKKSPISIVGYFQRTSNRIGCNTKMGTASFHFICRFRSISWHLSPFLALLYTFLFVSCNIPIAMIFFCSCCSASINVRAVRNLSLILVCVLVLCLLDDAYTLLFPFIPYDFSSSVPTVYYY